MFLGDTPRSENEWISSTHALQASMPGKARYFENGDGRRVALEGSKTGCTAVLVVAPKKVRRGRLDRTRVGDHEPRASLGESSCDRPTLAEQVGQRLL